MPFYDFKCKNDHYITRMMSIVESENPLTFDLCKECGLPVFKTISMPTIHGANTGGRGQYKGNL